MAGFFDNFLAGKQARMQEQQFAQEQQAQQMKQRASVGEFLHRAAQAIADAPAEQRANRYRGALMAMRQYPEAQEWVQHLPPDYDEATVLPVIQQILGGTAGYAGQNNSASLNEFNAMTSGMDPNDITKAKRINLGLDPRASSAAPYGFTEVMGPDGKTYLVQTNKITGAIAPTGMVSPTAGEVKQAEAYGTGTGKTLSDQDRADFDARQAAAVAQATAEGKAAGERGANIAKRTQDAKMTLDLLDEADGLLDSATGSGAGAKWDAANAFFGRSTEGAQANASLQTLSGRLTMLVPRMEGPQSDADRLLYQKAAGDLGNPEMPIETRKAAAATIRKLQMKYADDPAPSRRAASKPSGPPHVRSQAEYDALPSGAVYTEDDGQTYRKP